jgi:5-methylcytosine-specific restriction endonuclease McrA
MPRFRVTVTMVYDIETTVDHSDASKMVEADLATCLADKSLVRKQVRLERLKERRCNIHLGEFDPSEVLPYICKEEMKKDYKVGDKVYTVRMNSQRYFIFRESLKCVACGLEGTKMILEQNPADKSPHFNLYAVENDRLVLMTKDHVQPKAYGGEDRHSNYQTMCSICNNLKGSANITVESIRELRRIYNENRETPRKKLRELLDEAKKRLAMPRSEPRIGKSFARKRYLAERKSKETLINNTDIHVWRLPSGNLVGRSVYENRLEGAEIIACVKQGTECESLGHESHKIRIKLSEEESFLVYQGYLDYKEHLPELEEEKPEKSTTVVDEQAVS